MMYSAAIPRSVNEKLLAHLLRNDGQEDLCFALWYPSQGRERRSALLQTVVLPTGGERRVHGNASFLPSYFERALNLALENGAGIAFLHSHLGPGWQDMSEDDINAEKSIAASTQAATGMALLGLTLGTDGAWSARFWQKTAPRTYNRIWCSSVRVVGEHLRVTFNDTIVPKYRFRTELSRTVSAWGEKQQQALMRLRIGIIGAGSVGSIIAESLARIGIAQIVLVDFDSIEQINLDRILHANHLDALLQRSKVKVLSRALEKSATASPLKVSAYEYSIIEEEGFRAALDCDLLFSCVDRPWARSVLNFIAYAHLIPVIDGGIRAERKKSGLGLLRADWRVQTVAPSRPCLECLGQYNSGDVATEREGYLDNPSYIAGLPDNHFIKHNENVFAFSLGLAAQEVQHFLTLALSLPGGLSRRPQLYHFVQDEMDYLDQSCNTFCLFPSYVAYGDCAPIKVTGVHQAAVNARTKRAKYQRSPRYWIARIFGW